MYLIAGLGNSGKKYELTRHNVGFIVIGVLAARHSLKLKNTPKFQTYLAEGEIDQVKCILSMPMAYMNNSGIAVSQLVKFYKIPAEKIIVIHDDIDLPFGKVRVSFDASSGGHNGVKSIISSLGTQKFIRVRIGIGNDLSESRSIPSEKFVLQRFSKDEIKNISGGMQKYIEAVEMVVKEGYEKAMGWFNG